MLINNITRTCQNNHAGHITVQGGRKIGTLNTKWKDIPGHILDMKSD